MGAASRSCISFNCLAQTCICPKAVGMSHTGIVVGGWSLGAGLAREFSEVWVSMLHCRVAVFMLDARALPPGFNAMFSYMMRARRGVYLRMHRIAFTVSPFSYALSWQQNTVQHLLCE